MGGLKGLVDGVGLEVFDVRDETLMPLMVPTGEILEGSVPALPLLAGLLMPDSVTGTRSGKPSCEGDSGISYSGVDVPLVGGPQMLGDNPVCACSSRVRFGNSREPDSCSGEPAPTLTLFKPARPLVRFGSPNGDFDEAPVDTSETGDIPERLRLSLLSGLEPGAMSRLWKFVFQEVRPSIE
jgi:hypothetical protein